MSEVNAGSDVVAMELKADKNGMTEVHVLVLIITSYMYRISGSFCQEKISPNVVAAEDICPFYFCAHGSKVLISFDAHEVKFETTCEIGEILSLAKISRYTVC